MNFNIKKNITHRITAMDFNIIYLGVIVLLILLVVYFYAKYKSTESAIKEIEERFGVGELYKTVTRRKNGDLRKYNEANLIKAKTMKEYKTEIEEALAAADKEGDYGTNERLAAACRSATMGGKHLRAIILMEISRCSSISTLKKYNLKPTDPIEAAISVEYIHSASLVIDDLPEFDNDETRRGRPSVHAEFGKSTAMMATSSLVALSMCNLCRQVDWVRDNRPEIKNIDRIGTKICSIYSEMLGARGLTGGQMTDVFKGDEDDYIELMQKKTAVLFEMAFMFGWIITGNSPQKLDQVREAGRSFGLAFQIADDLADMEKDAETSAATGKPNWNFANKYGEQVALMEFKKYISAATLLLKQLDLWSKIWEAEIIPLIEMPAAPSQTNTVKEIILASI